MTQLRSYHFSLGNSFKGPIGFCARVFAETPEAAVIALQERLHDLQGGVCIHPSDHLDGTPFGDEYIEVYVNPDAVSADDIDEDNPLDDEPGGG